MLDIYERVNEDQLRRDGVNPKELQGIKKPPLHLIPPVADIHMAMALKFGAYHANGGEGYGPFNWRETDINLSTYIGAIKRHISELQDGEDHARDSHCHHLAHIMACCAIALDSMELGRLVDDRAPNGNASELIERLTEEKNVETPPSVPLAVVEPKPGDDEIPFQEVDYEA